MERMERIGTACGIGDGLGSVLEPAAVTATPLLFTVVVYLCISSIDQFSRSMQARRSIWQANS